MFTSYKQCVVVEQSVLTVIFHVCKLKGKNNDFGCLTEESPAAVMTTFINL